MTMQNPGSQIVTSDMNRRRLFAEIEKLGLNPERPHTAKTMKAKAVVTSPNEIVAVVSISSERDEETKPEQVIEEQLATPPEAHEVAPVEQDAEVSELGAKAVEQAPTTENVKKKRGRFGRTTTDQTPES
jgi:hypothetical protein